MGESDKTRAFTTRIIWFVVGIFFLVTVISQAVIYFRTPVRTEVATLYTTTESISFKGVCVRDEKTVSYPHDGIISYTHPDGSKIAKTSVIAQVYKNRSDISIKQQIEELSKTRSVLTEAQSLAGTDTSQLESFSNQIGDKHLQIMQCIYDRDYEDAAALKSDLLSLQAKREIVKGSEQNYADKIAEIDRWIAELRSMLLSEPTDITINETGYFISKVDGYENDLDSESVMELSAAQIDEITSAEMPSENPKGMIGKLVSDYSWYMAAVLESVRLGTVFQGANVTLRIGSSQQNVEAQIVRLTKEPDGRCVAVFKCDMFLADFISSRVMQAKLIMENYTGIRIPSQALKFEGGQIGVYIRDGIVVKFKKIRQMLSDPDFVLAEDTTGEEGFLQVYDSIIVEGRELYDGKIIE